MPFVVNEQLTSCKNQVLMRDEKQRNLYTGAVLCFLLLIDHEFVLFILHLWLPVPYINLYNDFLVSQPENKKKILNCTSEII